MKINYLHFPFFYSLFNIAIQWRRRFRKTDENILRDKIFTIEINGASTSSVSETGCTIKFCRKKSNSLKDKPTNPTHQNQKFASLPPNISSLMQH